MCAAAAVTVDCSCWEKGTPTDPICVSLPPLKAQLARSSSFQAVCCKQTSTSSMKALILVGGYGETAQLIVQPRLQSLQAQVSHPTMTVPRHPPQAPHAHGAEASGGLLQQTNDLPPNRGGCARCCRSQQLREAAAHQELHWHLLLCCPTTPWPCFLVYLQALKAAGVTEVILAINYQPEVSWQQRRVDLQPALLAPATDEGGWAAVVRCS